MSELLAGRHATLEALRAGRRHFYRLWLEGDEKSKPGGIVAEIVSLCEGRSLPIRTIRGGVFERLKEGGVNHQGVALEVGDYPYVDITALLARARRGGAALFLLLDHLQDPQNLGTLIRTAEAMGVDGIVIPDRRAAGVTPAVSNASAGAVEHLPVAQVTNLNRAIEEFKKVGVWVAGLDMGDDAILLEKADLTGALALVVGSEGSGLSRLTREKCDFIIRLPMFGRVQSLNASVAGSIVLYAARRQRAAEPAS
ncbi:MAG: 23S rRNA (guanosine(2251)-2'-O)-methyltransferase RlmB [Caldilineaceae bacterium]|nr:23S rRNA (guanosine(2251)-2'-O)-methyltransferase RlmB [Caldilineaceae bacterium]